MSNTAATKNDPLIEIENLSVTFGRQNVLRDINLKIQRGQTVAIIGESGCGKTVLLKTIVGLVGVTRGKVLFDGRDIHSLGEKELTKQRLRFGFVFQQAALFDSLTIFENIAFALREHRELSDADIEHLVRERVAEVGLSPDVLSRKPAELSGGMRKRVGFARAIALGPEVILYDEPTTGLDPIMSDVINELVLRMRRSYPVTSIIVTHDMKSALKVADRVIMLYPLARLGPEDRQVIFDGPALGVVGSTDLRVTQFVRGEAGERMMELERDVDDLARDR